MLPPPMWPSLSSDRQAAHFHSQEEAHEPLDAAFQKCLEEGDFGNDRQRLQQACGLHSPVLPCFSTGQLQTAEVVHLCTAIGANPHAFDDWLALIKQVEAHGSVEERSSLYEAFLAEFPLCWGYWKRLAELQTQQCGHSSGLQVYQRALAIVPACVDLWVQYCEAAILSNEVEEESLRRIFEKAVETVGHDWRAFSLWDIYFNFEEKGRRWKRLGSLLQRALAIPMQGLPAVRVRLRSLILGDAAPPLEELCSESVLDKLGGQPEDEKGTDKYADKSHTHNTQSMLKENQALGTQSQPPLPLHPEAKEMEDGEIEESDESDNDGEIDEGEDERPVDTHPEVQAVPPAAASVTQPAKAAVEEKTTNHGESFLNLREELWSRTSSQAAILMQYEAPLHRQYFHNKPLSAAQLDAWRAYLDFEESRCPREWQRLCALFERCLIVTNNYLEFWLRYARALQAMEVEQSASAKPEASCSLLRGACLNGRLSRRPDALAAWAELEEQCGRLHRASALLDAALQTCGQNSTELVIRRVALEMRRCDAASALSLLEGFVLTTVDLKSRAFLSRRYARLAEDCLRQAHKAAEFLMDAWIAGCRECGLLLELTSLIMRTAPGRAEAQDAGQAKLSRCMALFEEAIHDAGVSQALDRTSAAEEVSQLWACYVDFLLTHGASIQILQNVQDRARSFRCQATSRPSMPTTPTKKKRRSFDLSPENTSSAACKMAVNQKQARCDTAGLQAPVQSGSKAPKHVVLSESAVTAHHGAVLGA